MSEHIAEIFLTSAYNPSRLILTEEEESRLARINSPKVRRHFESSHTFLNSILIDRLEISPEELEFKFNEFGKPYLSDQLFNKNSVYFSLSHSNGGVAVGISTGYEIGIDLENFSKRSINSCKKLASRYFGSKEQKYLAAAACCDLEYSKIFHRIWTLKEAYLKAAGTGINTTLSALDFELTGNLPVLYTDNDNLETSYHFHTTEHGRFQLSLACRTESHLSIKISEYSQE